MKKRIVVKAGAKVPFCNHVDYCIGTGRMGLALTKEYQEQLKYVQEEIGFSHIRGHGLFCDDMAIYQEYEEDGNKETEYNFTYLDRVMDSYLEFGIRPFLELGFMPQKLASGTQTIFYWKGNTTPPKDYDEWCRLVQALLRHLIKRYGEDVLNWPIEVWNEPNLWGFWEKADMQEYFKLFHRTFQAVKEVDQGFRVGGPAVCGGSDEKWIKAFMEFCHDRKIPVDFVTRHHYTVEFPERKGHYEYSRLMDPEDGFANLKTTRDIIDSFPEYKGLEIHITEFNTSYTPRGVIHDTNLNAALIAGQLSRLGDYATSYSYWTFGDVFEEAGVPFAPFHGGFGLVAEGGIPKPTFWTFAFFKKLSERGDTCVYRDDNLVVLRDQRGNYCGVAWNIFLRADDEEGTGKEEKNKRLKEKMSEAQRKMEITLPVQADEYSVVTETVDEEVCNPLKVWHDLGEPANLTREHKKILKESSNPLVRTERIGAFNGGIKINLELGKNAVVYFEVRESCMQSDRGYDWERANAGF